MADSAFNESELHALGYDDTAVVPLLIDMHRKSDEPDPALMADLARRKAATGGADLLFVGKVSPHKAPHDLVKMLAVLRRLYDPAARLHLVGSPLGETYEPALRAFIDELGLDRRRQLRRVGHRSRARGVPAGGRRVRLRLGPRRVLRAPGRGDGTRRPDRRLRGHRGARDGGQAGLVLPDKSPVHFAAAVARVLADPALRQHLRRRDGPGPPSSACPTRNDASCHSCRSDRRGLSADAVLSKAER